jgi:hypothetical protein
MDSEFDAIRYCLVGPTCHPLFFLILPYLLPSVIASRRSHASITAAARQASSMLARAMAATCRTPPRSNAPWLLLVRLAHVPELRELGPCHAGAEAALRRSPKVAPRAPDRSSPAPEEATTPVCHHPEMLTPSHAVAGDIPICAIF